MSNSITAHFRGREPTKQFVKSIVSSVDNGKKSALTTSLEKFKKEINTFLTECIEKNRKESSNTQSWYTISKVNLNYAPEKYINYLDSLAIDEEEIDSEDETISEISVSQRPSKAPKLV